MDQEKVWDAIAARWAEYKNRPSPEVENFLKNKEGEILDLGCGSGRNFQAFPKNSSIYAFDFSKEMLKFATRKAKKIGLKIKTFYLSSNKIPFEGDFFDSGICIAVLHCIPTKKARQKMICELYRVLKRGAEALIMVWSKSSPRLKNKPKETFVPWISAGIKKRYTYIYDKEEIGEKVKKAGFEIIKIWENENINVIVRKPISF